MNFEKCKKCKATYEGHGGLRCCLDGQAVEYNTMCCFWKEFGKWHDYAEKAGYILSAIVIGKDKVECPMCKHNFDIPTEEKVKQ